MVAVLLVHGIGNQNRFDFLSDFTAGLIAGPRQKKPRRKEAPSGDDFRYEKVEGAEPLGTALPLKVTVGQAESGHSVEAHFYESYWSPLMTGATNIFSVIAFIGRTLYRLFPWNLSDRTSERRPKYRLGRWVYSAAYLSLSLAILSMFAYIAIGATILVLDRAYVKEAYAAKILPAFAEQQALAEKGFDKASSGQVSDEMDRLTSQIKSIDANYLVDYKRTYSAAYQADNDWERLDEVPAGKVLTPLQSLTIASRNLPSDAAYFAQDAFLHLLSRGALISDQVVPKWPEVLPLFSRFGFREVALGVLLSFLFWTVLFGSMRTVLTALAALRGEIRPSGFKLTVSALALALLYMFAAYLSSAEPTVFQLALCVLLARIVWAIGRVFLVETLGDIEVYAQHNANDRRFITRNRVIQQTSSDIEKLLKSDYGAVIVVGHSLGSVVAMESLRRLYFQANHDGRGGDLLVKKLRRMITLGSPLLKFSVFFAAGRNQSNFDEFSADADHAIFRNAGTWLNFWHWCDIVADPLRSYGSITKEDIHVRCPISKWWWPHSFYWHLDELKGELAQAITALGREQVTVEAPAAKLV
jgi:hypothetical protein